jgi:hypothetical protein
LLPSAVAPRVCDKQILLTNYFLLLNLIHFKDLVMIVLEFKIQFYFRREAAGDRSSSSHKYVVGPEVEADAIRQFAPVHSDSVSSVAIHKGSLCLSGGQDKVIIILQYKNLLY